jgi:hypothetical protein
MLAVPNVQPFDSTGPEITPLKRKGLFAEDHDGGVCEERRGRKGRREITAKGWTP